MRETNTRNLTGLSRLASTLSANKLDAESIGCSGPGAEVCKQMRKDEQGKSHGSSPCKGLRAHRALPAHGMAYAFSAACTEGNVFRTWSTLVISNKAMMRSLTQASRSLRWSSWAATK